MGYVCTWDKLSALYLYSPFQVFHFHMQAGDNSPEEFVFQLNVCVCVNQFFTLFALLVVPLYSCLLIHSQMALCLCRHIIHPIDVDRRTILIPLIFTLSFISCNCDFCICKEQKKIVAFFFFFFCLASDARKNE